MIELRSDRQGFVLLGMDAHFSQQVAVALLQRGCRPIQAIEYAESMTVVSNAFDDREIEVHGRPSAFSRSVSDASIPVDSTSSGSLYELLANLSFDYLLTACWPTLIPQSVTELAGKAALNLHPSLLPRYAGATPIQDQLQQGDHQFGVTLHRLSQQYDQGDILLQKDVVTPATVDLYTVESVCADKGAELFCQLINE